MNEERRKKITDMQVRAFMAFARSIRPGWRAKALALPLIALVKLLGIRKDRKKAAPSANAYSPNPTRT